MAVTLNSNGSYRADFMISNAAVSQKAKQTQVSQDNGFAKLLDSRSSEQSKPIGSVNSSESVNVESTYKAPEVKSELERVCEVPEQEALVLEPSEEMNIVSDEVEHTFIGSCIPEDTMDLARAIVRGDIDINDVPVDRLTPELLKAIMMVKKLENPDDDDDEDKDDKEEDVLKPVAQYAAQETDAAMTLEDQILALIMLVLDGNSEEDEIVTKVEVFPETVTEKVAEVTAVADDTLEAFEYTQANEAAAAEKIAAEVPEEAAQAVQATQTVQADNAVQAADVTTQPKKSEATAQAPNVESGAEGKVIVRKIAQPEEKSDLAKQESGEQNASQNQQQPVVTKEISEELEMLRNAKLGSKAKTEFAVESGNEKTAESVKTDAAAPVHTANPLMADSPIMLAGKDGAMIQVRPSEVMAQVTKIVEQAISQNIEQTEYSMVLNPEELGRITVKLIKAADGAVSVTIVAENASTQRMLEQNGELMQSNLRANGVQLQSWQTVNEAHQETMQREYDGSSKNPYYREESKKTEDDQPEGESFADIIAAM